MLAFKFFFRWTKQPFFWAAVVALIYTAVTLFITIHLLHDSYHTSAFDLGIFTQELKNTLHGQILYSPAIGGSQFMPHFSPVLLLLVPVYWFFPHPQMLLVVQGLLLGFGGYLVYVLAREYNYSHRAGLVIEGLYGINPLLWGLALFDFHTEAFVIPALLLMFLGWKKKNWIYFGLGLFFTLASKEDVVLTLAVFGVVLVIADYWQHRKVSKISVIIFCASVLTYSLGVLVSHLASHGEPARILSYFSNRYTYLGQPLSVGVPLAFHTVFSMDSLFLIIAYLVPLAFIPLLSPKWSFPALLILLSGVLSTNLGQHGELSQYQAVALPFLFIAFIKALPKVLANPRIQYYLKITKNRALTYTIVFMVLISLGVISEGRISIASLPDAHDAAINQLIALVPDNAVVTAGDFLFPHLCSRTDTYLNAVDGASLMHDSGIIKADWGFPDKDTEYVVIDVSNQLIPASDLDIIFKHYTLIKSIDGVELYQLDS